VAIQFGRNPVFILNSISFLFSMVMILMVRIPQPGKGAGRQRGNFLASSWKEFREGLTYIRSIPIVLAIMWLTAGWSFGNGSARVVYPLFGAAFAKTLHKADDFGIAILYVAMGTGSVLGTIFVARFLRLEQSDLTKTIGIAVVWDGLCLTLFSFTRNLWIGAFLLMCRDIGFAIWRSAQQTELMRETEDAMRGRVFATYETISALLMMITMVLAGPTIERIGPGIVTTIAGGLILGTGVLWYSKVVLSTGYVSKAAPRN
jgi:predicted MFS family arabinose efflux permease